MNEDLEEVFDGVDEKDTREEVVESQEQNTKTYSEEEVETIKAQMKEDNQKAWNKRWGQEKSKMERKYAKQDELINLLKEQTGKSDLSDLLDYSYEQYGVEKPITTNSKDEEVLGKNDAKEILELDDESIEEEANRLAGINNRTAREQATFMELGNYLTSKRESEKRKNEIKEAGIDEEVLDNQDFKDFMSKFNQNTSVADIYDLYSKTHEVKKKPFSAGSVKGKQVKEESEFFTEEEFQNLTEKDLEDDRIYEKAMKSRLHFN